MKIVIDAMGGDKAPYEIVKGGVDALNKYNDLKIVFCGDKGAVEKILKNLKYDVDRVELIHTSEVIKNDEMPTRAIREKKDSSLVVAFDILKEDKDVVGLISAGSTGAILAGGFLKIGRLKGASRPSLAPFLPTQKGGNVLVVDCGANMDAKPINLCHFAIMGSEYYKEMFGVEKPRVALLNVGTESHKGDELTLAAYSLLKKLDINFVGSMEARDLMSGNYDVVVTDGFSGNVLLKATEGALKTLLQEIKKEIKSSFLAKLGGLFLIKPFKNLKKKYDFDVYGGAPLLGCKKLIIKSHGSSKARSIEASVREIVKLSDRKLNEKIETALSKIEKLETENVWHLKIILLK